MTLWHHLELVFLFGPIVGLLVAGVLISAQSGLLHSPNPQGVRHLLGNLSLVLVRVVGYVVGLFAIQHLVGFPIGLGW